MSGEKKRAVSWKERAVTNGYFSFGMQIRDKIPLILLTGWLFTHINQSVHLDLDILRLANRIVVLCPNAILSFSTPF